MAPAVTKFKMTFYIFLILVISMNQASTSESSGLLARLYKQAAQENRPLVLVLDNSDRGQHKNMANPKRVLSLDSVEKDVTNPFMYMYPIEEAQRSVYAKISNGKTHQDLTERRPRNTNRDKRLKHRGNRNKHEDRDRHEEKNMLDNRDKYRLKSSHDHRDWQQNKRQIKNPLVDRHRLEDRNRHEDLDKRGNVDHREKARWEDEDEKVFLRSPVIRSLLRISKSLQCGAKDRCQDKCNGKFKGKKLDDCEDKCEVKYDCDEEAEEESDPCERGECEESNECDASDEECNMSTKGERLITVTPKCKRC